MSGRRSWGSSLCQGPGAGSDCGCLKTYGWNPVSKDWGGAEGDKAGNCHGALGGGLADGCILSQAPWEAPAKF